MDGAFDLLFNVYKQQRTYWNGGPTTGPYLVEHGSIPDAGRLEAFVHAIGSVETEILTEREKNDAAYVR